MHLQDVSNPEFGLALSSTFGIIDKSRNHKHDEYDDAKLDEPSHHGLSLHSLLLRHAEE